MKNILITGGCGFIGSAVVRYFLRETNYRILNIDKLTYAVHPNSLADVKHHARYHWVKADIIHHDKISNIINEFKPCAVLHLAAESHVDNAIHTATKFLSTNILGTHSLLEACLKYWQTLNSNHARAFRFIQVSTDEVFGDTPINSTEYFQEASAYHPNNPYSASKAAADHLVYAWWKTYGLPIIITHSSNNYGPFQHYEKLIPKTITRAIAHQPIPIYGSGLQVRDWLHVDDHVTALNAILHTGRVGEHYNISAKDACSNIKLVCLICNILDEIQPVKKKFQSYHQLITHVSDRMGHDQRYAIDTSKILQETTWQPKHTLTQSLAKVVKHYLQQNPSP